MKNLYLIITLFSISLVCCTNSGQKQSTEAVVAYSADTLYSVAESFIDQPIAVKGFVTHVCSHAGKRCFITGVNQDYSIRVEATGEINAFDKELIGTEVLIDGILRERRLTQAEIAEMEMDVNERMELEENGTAESCEAELANINEMKEWMQAQGKDYYSIYYIDGLDYHEVTN